MVRVHVTFNEDEFAYLQTVFNEAKTQVKYGPLANATLLALSRATLIDTDADADGSTTDVPPDPDDMETWQDSGDFVPLDDGQGDTSVPPTMGD